MTLRQAKIIFAYAENDMNTAATAKQLYYHKRTVSYHLLKIQKQMGWNPRKFYDLCYLVGVALQRTGGKRHGQGNEHCMRDCDHLHHTGCGTL